MIDREIARTDNPTGQIHKCVQRYLTTTLAATAAKTIFIACAKGAR